MKMKMVMAILPRDEAEGVLHTLVSAGHTATFTESRGGMLRQAQQTLFIAVEEQDLQTVLDIVRPDLSKAEEDAQTGALEAFGPEATPSSPPIVSPLGGTVVFIWDIERYEGVEP